LFRKIITKKIPQFLTKKILQKDSAAINIYLGLPKIFLKI
jgi:hypothetical protein